MFKNILITLLLLFSVVTTYSQNKSAFHINIKNGLATNLVYQAIKDHYGYLWLATENGVVKYNGYELKKFNLSNGLSDNDVWRLHEDNKGRIWVHTISDELGYIYNNRYQKIIFKDSTPGTIHPTGIVNTKDGVAFFTGRNAGSNVMTTFCVEKNDTVRYYKILTTESYIDTTFYHETMHVDGYGILVQDHQIKKLYIQNDSLHVIKLCSYTNPTDIKREKATYILHGNYFLVYEQFTDKVYYTDIRTSKTYKLNRPGGANRYIYTMTFQNNKLHIVSNKDVSVYNQKMELLKTIEAAKTLPNFVPGNDNITSLLDDSFWGVTLTTKENGAYINCNASNFKIKKELPPIGYSLIGHSKDSSSFWWNNDDLTLCITSKKNRYIHKIPHGIGRLTQAIPYDNKKTLLISPDSMYWYNTQSNTLTNFLNNISKYTTTDQAWKMFTSKDYIESVSGGISSAVFTSANSLSVVTKRRLWYHLYFNADSINNTTYLYKRLQSTTYDAKRKMLYGYDAKNIFLKPLPDGRVKHINKAMLNAIGIKKLEKILIDSFGNIFLKDYDNLIFFNPDNLTYRLILKNNILHNTNLFFFKNKLVVAGDFGVSFITINGLGRFSSPYVELNTKETQYERLISSYVVDNDVLLYTDKGLYNLQIPADNRSNQNNEAYKYIVVASANANTKNVNQDDTIYIHPSDYTLLLDVIKPSGVGKLSLKYKISDIDKNWTELAGNEIYTASLSPGKYYSLSIIANDEIWLSKTIKLKIFIIPYWWQTTLAKNLLILLAIIFTLGLVAFTVFITRKILSRKHHRQSIQLELKNLNLALELKSIYSQINPHFIFNTLSTALYYIKKKKVDEAYTHITSFSDLLRAYIKSSRNKYITIEEETENLINYITLQQARFENKFNYQIIKHNSIDARKTMIPSLLLQPLVENAINHGLLPSENENGQLSIHFKPGENKADIICVIDDNGIGRERSKLLKKETQVKTESYGTDLIHELVEVFNKNENINITLDYIDKTSPQTGTTVVITIKQKTQ